MDFDTTYAIQTDKLVKRFGDFTALDELSLAIKPGTIYGFLGANGSGKSTTIRILCGILTQTSGTATILGRDITTHRDEIKQLIGYMSQKFSLYPDLTTLENLEFYAGLYGLQGAEKKNRMDELIHLMKLEDRLDTLTGHLSGGWKQNVALACSILHKPKVLFLDEPTGGVDPVSRRNFWDLIYRLGMDGTTIMVTTHLMDEAEHCQEACIISRGRLITQGTTKEMKESIQGRLLIIYPKKPSMDAFEELQASGLPYIDAYVQGSNLHVLTSTDADFSFLGDVTAMSPSMEDVFIYYDKQGKGVAK